MTDGFLWRPKPGGQWSFRPALAGRSYPSTAEFMPVTFNAAPAPIPAVTPVERKETRPKCPGTGRQDVTVITEPSTYRLASSGRMHTLPGRALCPVCGRDTAYRPSYGIVTHKAPEGTDG